MTSSSPHVTANHITTNHVIDTPYTRMHGYRVGKGEKHSLLANVSEFVEKRLAQLY